MLFAVPIFFANGTLKKAKRDDLAAGVEQSTAKVKAAGRNVDDLVEPLQTAMALRDMAAQEIDSLVYELYSMKEDEIRIVESGK